MSKRFITLLAGISLIAIILIVGQQCERRAVKTESTKRYEARKKTSQWKSPTSEEMETISSLLVANNISGCGEYYIQEPSAGEYLIACTSEGSTWNYYVVWPRVDDKVYQANDEMLVGVESPY